MPSKKRKQDWTERSTIRESTAAKRKTAGEISMPNGRIVGVDIISGGMEETIAGRPNIIGRTILTECDCQPITMRASNERPETR